MNGCAKVLSHPALYVRLLSVTSACIVLFVGGELQIEAPGYLWWGAGIGILLGFVFWLEIRGGLQSGNQFPVTVTQKCSYAVVLTLYAVLAGCILGTYVPEFSSPGSSLLLGRAFHLSLGVTLLFSSVQIFVLALHLRRHGRLEREVWKERQTGREGMIHLTGTVTNRLDPEGKVLLRGEIWTGISETGKPIDKGERVRVSRMEGLRAYVYQVPTDTHK